MEILVKILQLLENSSVEHRDAAGQILLEAERESLQAASQGDENTAVCNTGAPSLVVCMISMLLWVIR